jgi:Flp pilus assembly protein TadD
MFKKEVGPTHLIDDQYRAFLGDLNAIYQKRKDLVLGELASYPNQKADIQKALEKLNPIAKQAGSAEGPSSENTNPSGTGVNKNFLVIVAGLVIVIVSYFAFGGRKESDSITTATPQQSSATASIPKIETPSTDATIQASAANTVNTSEQASPSTLNPRSEPQSNEVSAQSNEANQQNAGLSCSSIEDCIRRSLFAANLEDVESIRKIATAIDQLPKPDLGNKQVSRKLNAQGLESLRRGDFEEAVNTLKLALKENPKDVEISSNLGFSLVKAGRYKEAISVLNGSLVLDPRRTSTWTPLAEAYALDNKPNEAVASIWVALQWSADRDKSIAYYADRIEKERGERQQLFDLYRAILNWSNGSKPDIRL